MAKTYVVGIGGSGSRVIRALTAILTSGADAGGNEIVPLIIDVDGTNEDTRRSLLFVEEYLKHRERFYTQGQFFKTKIGQPSGTYASVADSLKIPVFESNQTFARYIGYEQGEKEVDVALSDLDKDFIDSIFSTSQTTGDEELYLNMSEGFKGHPNIGCIAFNEIKNSTVFRNIINEAAAAPGNKIFIISSIFGGTGASGFPQLLQIIDNSVNNGTNANIRNVPVGALSVFPYFNVAATNDNTGIKSSKFMTKSKAALYYYEDQMSRLNSMYNLYDTPFQSFTYSTGGTSQKNNALWTELIGAYAVLNFINDDAVTVNAQKTYGFFSQYEDEHGAKTTLPNEITYTNFYAATQKEVLKPLIKLGLLWYITCKHIEFEQKRNSTYFRDLRLDDPNSAERKAFDELKKFLNDFFYDFIKEIQANSRTFKLFNLDANDLNGFISFNRLNDPELAAGEFSGEVLNHKISDRDYIDDNPAKKVMKFLEKAVDIVFEKIKI